MRRLHSHPPLFFRTRSRPIGRRVLLSCMRGRRGPFPRPEQNYLCLPSCRWHIVGETTCNPCRRSLWASRQAIGGVVEGGGEKSGSGQGRGGPLSQKQRWGLWRGEANSRCRSRGGECLFSKASVGGHDG